MAATSAPLPPGTMGLPFLGETLAFGQNPFRFLDDRHKRYGDVFKSSLFGRKIVSLAGTEGAEAFYDAQNISRASAHPTAGTSAALGADLIRSSRRHARAARSIPRGRALARS